MSSGGHVALSSAALIPGKGCEGNSSTGFRDPVFSYPMVAQQQPGPRDGPSSVFTELSHSQSGNPQGSSQRSGAWRLNSLLSTLHMCFSLSAIESSLCDKARVPELPRPTENPVTNRQRTSVCVCAKEAWCAVCLCMHLFTLS